MEELMLIPEPNPLKSGVMSRAHELRAEGYDPSEALKQAWSEANGDDDDDANEFMLTTNPPADDNVDSEGVAIIGLGLAYIAWCWYESVRLNRPWTWTPWKKTILSRRFAESRFMPHSKQKQEWFQTSVT
ncbi:MAG: hypothetical protein JXB29_02665 [Sedimentisphaerales bacterium]|nr:hypothetical protein [Sedimentisphaerales bacterium]